MPSNCVPEQPSHPPRGHGVGLRGRSYSRFLLAAGPIIAAVALGLLTSVPASAAQQSAKIPRVGVLTPQKSTEPPTRQREPFERGLRELGWTPGSNLIIEYRYAEGQNERLPDLAAELVRLKADVIVARGTMAIRAARQATGTIPIVMAASPDPVREGIVASLARPGGNITGLSFLAQGPLEGKRLELLKETVPHLARVADLANPSTDQDGAIKREMTAAARSLGLEVQTFEVKKPQDIPKAFAAIGKARVGALLVRADPAVLVPNFTQVVALAFKHRLPAMYPWKDYVDAGGLMSYATSLPGFHHRSATYVNKILKGAKPADLPVEQPTRFELAINMKTAKALGLTIPASVLIRADQVIQ